MRRINLSGYRSDHDSIKKLLLLSVSAHRIGTQNICGGACFVDSTYSTAGAAEMSANSSYVVWIWHLHQVNQANVHWNRFTFPAPPASGPPKAVPLLTSRSSQPYPVHSIHPVHQFISSSQSRSSQTRQVWTTSYRHEYYYHISRNSRAGLLEFFLLFPATQLWSRLTPASQQDIQVAASPGAETISASERGETFRQEPLQWGAISQLF